MFGFFTKIKLEMLVGVLIIVSGVILIYSSIKVTGFNKLSQKGYRIEVIFDNVAGLSEKTAVRLAGIQIGVVEKIELKNSKASITLYIFQQYKLPNDSIAKIQTLGLLGDRYIEIIVGNSIENFKDNEQMLTHRGKNLDDVIGNANEITESLLRIIENNETAINEIIENIKQVSASLRRLANKNEEKINQLLDNVNKTVASLQRITNNNEEKLNELIDNLNSFSIELADIADEKSLKNSLTNISSITEKIDKGEGTLGKLINETDTVDKINKALDDISDLLGNTALWKYDVGFQTKYLPTRKQFHSDFSFTINTQKDRFYRFGLIDSPNGKQNEESIVRTITTSSNDIITTIQERKTTDEYLLSLQVGKKFYDTQVRIGFFESSFGIGVDQFLGKKNNWKFSSDIFQFARDEGAFLNFDSSYRYNALKLRLGLYDVINSNQSQKDWSIGIGLEFNEDDLRVLGAGVLTGLSR